MKIVTTAFPFVPAKLGIHHFASTYIPADIYVRALRLMGENVYFPNATDFHSIFATNHGKIDEQLCESMHKEYIENYRALNVEFDNIITTDNEYHIKTVRKAIDCLNEKGLIYGKNSTDIYCCVCEICIPKSFVVREDGVEKCQLCGTSNLETVCLNHYWLKVTECKNTISKYVEEFTQDDAKSIAKSFLSNLSDWDFTRNNKFGLPYNESLSLYLWFESLVGYYSLVPDEIQGDFEFTHFIGKNITYYHSIIWPIMLDAISKDRIVKFDISVRGFMNLNSCIKTDINELCECYHPDLIRLYCAYKVRDSVKDFTMNEQELKGMKKSLIDGPVNFANRCIGMINNLCVEHINPCDEDYKNRIRQLYVDDIIANYTCHKINKAVKGIFDLVKFSQKELSKMIEEGTVDCDILGYLSMLTTALLSPIMPNLSRKISIFNTEEKPFLIQKLDDYIQCKIKHEKIII